ncbi:hypothetical protein DM860_008475 [Cuscuta australis]|uniref:Uncharacterized protein n=1 Tax=Cuscuta australis TaxID=267555 RepID=A0A328D4R6_9ASTE|nr:hypothetical protein DM860_008475 [Cuscuta australis]
MAFSFTPQPQQQSSLFQTPSAQQQPSPFPQFNAFSQTPQTQFNFQPQQSQPQQPQQQPQLFLFTNSKTPATYGTKWADLHPDSQKFLLKIEEKILEYRDESQRLDQCSRLYDSSVSNDGFELDSSHSIQELGGISTSMERQKTILQELMYVVKDMLRNTEVAVRSFMMLRPRFLHQNAPAAGSATASQSSGAIVPATSSAQATTIPTFPVFDFYCGIPKKPSPFLQQTVARFEKHLAECRQWVEELEQLILSGSDRNSLNTNASLLQSLPQVMSNVHDFFVHVAAKVESIHQYIESMKSAYLTDQRQRGDVGDPFLEADRRETAKQEAAARRVHPTLHLPVIPKPPTQVTGLLPSSATPGASTAPQTSAGIASSSAASGSSLFSTPAIATSSSSLFSTPIASTPANTLFGPGASPQTSLFAPSSTSTPAFSNTLFGTTPSSAATNFSTPFLSGAATGSGSSFGTLSKARGKSRTGRR